MNFFNKFFSKKNIFSGIAFAFLLFLLTTQFTHADGGGWLSIGSFANGIVSELAYDAGYLIAGTLGIIIVVESWLVGVVLNINANILQTTLVQNGFSISLSIANLFFVLGIIVIALATIIRSETYGIKKLLWKLVVAAVLVNFGLVIISPIFGLSNSFTQYFLNAINPTGGSSTSGVSQSLSNYDAFATKFTSAFNPQAGFAAFASSTATTGSDSPGYSGAFGAVSPSASALVIPIFGVLFLVINILLIVLVLAAFIALLFVRYLYIAILAILMPFAWASWVFPSFNSHWKTWWNNFLRWTFFAPIVLLFVYLALQTMTMAKTDNSNAFNVAAYTTSDSTFQALSTFLTKSFASVVQSFLQEIILVGLIVAGFVAANSMGIKMAGTAMNLAQRGVNTTKNAATRFTKNQAVKGVRRAYQSAGGQKLNHALQANSGVLSKEGKLGGIPLVGGVIRRGASLAGRGLESISTNENLVKEAQKKVPHSKEEVLTNLKGSMNNEDTFAHLATAVEKGWLTADTQVNGKKAADILDNKPLVQRYGQGGLAASADKLFMSNTNFRNGERAMQSGNNTAEVFSDIKDIEGNIAKDSSGREMKAGAKVNTQDMMDAAMQEFVIGMEKGDGAKININAVFAAPKNAQENTSQILRLKNIALHAPQLPASMISKARSGTLKNLEGKYPEGINAGRIEINNKISNVRKSAMSDADKKAQIDGLNALSEKITKQGDDFIKKTLVANILHGAHAEHEDHGGHSEDHGGGGHGGGGHTSNWSDTLKFTSEGGGGGHEESHGDSGGGHSEDHGGGGHGGGGHH